MQANDYDGWNVNIFAINFQFIYFYEKLRFLLFKLPTTDHIYNNILIKLFTAWNYLINFLVIHQNVFKIAAFDEQWKTYWTVMPSKQ